MVLLGLLDTPLVVNNVNSQLLLFVDQQVEVQMMVGNQSKTLTFDVAPLGKHNIVLGLPWLQQHNSMIHWTSRKVTFISNYCKVLQGTLSCPTCQYLLEPMLIVENEVSGLTVESLSEENIDLFMVEVPEHLEFITEVILELYWVKTNVSNGQKVIHYHHCAVPM